MFENPEINIPRILIKIFVISLLKKMGLETSSSKYRLCFPGLSGFVYELHIRSCGRSKQFPLYNNISNMIPCHDTIHSTFVFPTINRNILHASTLMVYHLDECMRNVLKWTSYHDISRMWHWDRYFNHIFFRLDGLIIQGEPLYQYRGGGISISPTWMYRRYAIILFTSGHHN